MKMMTVFHLGLLEFKIVINNPNVIATKWNLAPTKNYAAFRPITVKVHGFSTAVFKTSSKSNFT